MMLLQELTLPYERLLLQLGSPGSTFIKALSGSC